MKSTISLLTAIAFAAAATGLQASPMRTPPASPCAAFVALDTARDDAEFESLTAYRGNVARIINESKPDAAGVSLASRAASGVVIVRNPFFEARPRRRIKRRPCLTEACRAASCGGWRA
jgi:hypothetical protein